MYGWCRVKRILVCFACFQGVHSGVVRGWDDECDAGGRWGVYLNRKQRELRNWKTSPLNLIWNAPRPRHIISHWTQSVFKRFSDCNARFEIENILFWFSIRNYVFIPMKCQMNLGIYIHSMFGFWYKRFDCIYIPRHDVMRMFQRGCSEWGTNLGGFISLIYRILYKMTGKRIQLL